MKNDGPFKLNPNSAPFSPSVYDYSSVVNGPVSAAPETYYVGGNSANYDWWYLPEWSSQRLLSPNSMTKALSICREILENDLKSREVSALVGYINSNRLNRSKGLLSHPLSQLFIPPPRQRYIHPTITDHCLYALRCDRSNGKFCLTNSRDTPGFENDVAEDWTAAIVALLYYGLPPIRASIEAHTCVRSSSEACWLCELYFVFENLDQSRREGRAQPVSIRAFADSLMETQAMTSLNLVNADAEGSCINTADRLDIHHGLLSRKIYRRCSRLRKITPLLSEVHAPTSGNKSDEERRRANRICNGVRIRKHDRGLRDVIDCNRANVFKKVQHTLNYVLHMLNRNPALCKANEFPKLGETSGSDDGIEFLRIYADSHCQCPLTKTSTSTTKDMLLLPLNYTRHEQHKQGLKNQIISPDSSELSAFEDSVSSSNNSEDSCASEGGRRRGPYRKTRPAVNEPAGGGNGSSGVNGGSSSTNSGPPRRKASFNVFTAAASGALPKRQASVKFIDLLADTLVRDSEVLMMCASCCRLPGSGVRAHKIREEVSRLPIVLGLKMDGCDDFWKGSNGGDIRLLVRKYLKAKRQGSNREQCLSSELARIGASNTLPSQIHIGRKNGEWDVRATRASGYHEYTLTCVISAENVRWDQDTRSTLWRIWSEDFAKVVIHQDDIKSKMQVTEIEELMVERPPTEDIVCASIKRPDGTWMMINGPLIAEVSELEVKSFGVSYRRPICVFYGRTSLLWNWKRLTTNTIPDIDRLLSWNRSTAPNHLKVPPFTPLTVTEKKLIELNRFTLALDAEYVVSSYISKSKNHLLGNAPRYELGRFTGVRADKVFQEPATFADLYVHFSKLPLDCRTEYSGLVPSDLSSNSSTRWLVPREYVYRFVRFLVKNKCKFVGHDLFNDFRVIGITVPSNLVIDTVLLFRLSPQSRLLSLKYLAYTILNMTIQQSSHDSQEDSWASLLLYRFYCKYIKEHGEEDFTTNFLNQIYSIGYNTNFKTPLS